MSDEKAITIALGVAVMMGLLFAWIELIVREKGKNKIKNHKTK